VIPTAIDVVSQPVVQTGIMGIEGLAVFPADQPVIVQPLAVLGPVQQVGFFNICDTS
jgi:hypothetical protein